MIGNSMRNHLLSKYGRFYQRAVIKNDKFIVETQNLDPTSIEYITKFQERQYSMADNKVKNIFKVFKNIGGCIQDRRAKKKAQHSLENISNIEGCQSEQQTIVVSTTASSSSAVEQDIENDDENCFDLVDEETNDHGGTNTYAIYIDGNLTSFGEYEDVIDKLIMKMMCLSLDKRGTFLKKLK